jgi:hypothetical protein
MYAFTPAVNPADGSLTAWGSALKPGRPAVELVLLTLRTPRRSYAPDPDEGVDMDILQQNNPNTPALWKAEVHRALAKYVQNGVIRDVSVEVETSGGVLKYAVSFLDPRDTTERQTVRP